MRSSEFEQLLADGSEVSCWASIRFRLQLLARMAVGIAQRLSTMKPTRAHRFACVAAFCAVIMAPLPALAIDDGVTDLVTVPVGSYIIDPSPTTVNGGTRPYGAIYDLVKNQTVPVLWAINPTKVKDAADFTISGKSYSSSAFIISAEYASAAVVARIVFWRTQGVVIDGPITTAASSIPVYDKITSLPKTVLDSANLVLSEHFFIDASIPATAYRAALPAALTGCDDFYAMPHADPTYATHQLLKPFNARGGYIWAACHSVSVLEGVNATPPTAAQQLNFLSLNGLVNYKTPGHLGGDGSYLYATGSGGDPVMQFLGDLGPATENGSEQIYLPANPGSWRPTTKVLMWDSPHPDVTGLSPGLAAKLVYGRGFGVASNGRVMYEGGHNHDGAAAANVAAKRAFLNFWLLAGIDARPELAVTGLAATLAAGAPVSLAATVNGGSPAFTYAWTSSCGGTFSSPSAASTTFTPPSVTTATPCVVTLKVTDLCGRVNFQAQPIIVSPPAADMAATGNTLPTTVIAGQTVTGTITCSNNGPDLAAAASCTIPGLPAGATVSCTPTSPTVSPLASGSSMTCNVSYVAPASGTVSATVTAGSSTPDPIPLNNTTPYVATVAAQADMAATGNTLPTTVSAGQTVTGTITCKNNGASAATSATCTIPGLPAAASIACTPASPTSSPLPSGASMTCNVSYVAPGSGPVTATVTAGSTTPDSNTANNTSPYVATVTAVADMAATGHTLPTTVNAGQSVTGTVTCQNNGPSPAASATCTMPGLPAGATITCTPSSPTAAPLASGSSMICNVSYVAPLSGSVSATVTAGSATADTNPTNNTTPYAATVLAATDMAVTGSTLPTVVIAGGAVVGTVTCTNNGPSAAVAASCAISGLPAGATTVCAPTSPTSAPLASGASLVCTVNYTAPGAGVVTATIAAGSSTADTNPSNNTSPYVASLTPKADMQATVTGLPASAPSGTTISAIATCTNAGPSPAADAQCGLATLPSGATISCLPSPTPNPLAVGAAITCNVSLVVPTSGEVVITANAVTTTSDPDPSNNLAQQKTTVSPIADMQASTTVPAGPVLAGQSVTVSGRCLNAGPSAAVGPTCALTGLPIGATVSCTLDPTGAIPDPLPSGSAILCSSTFAAPGTGPLSIATTASAATADSNLTNNVDAKPLAITPQADMSAVTTVPASAVAGQPVTVSGRCLNSGPSPAAAPTCTLSGLPVGATQTCTLDPSGAIPDPLLSGAAIICTSTFASPSSGPLSITTTAGSTTVDNVPGNEIDTKSLSVDPRADMVVASNTLPTNVDAGQVVTGSITCANNGPSAATAASCAIPGLPSGATVICTPASPTAAPLPSGDSISCTVSYVAPAAGPVSASVTATSATTDPIPGNNTAPYSATVNSKADMAATGNTLPTSVGAGQTVSGIITCTNNGPSPADNANCAIPGLPVGASVSCTPATPTVSPLASGASITCNVSYVAPASGAVNATVTVGTTTSDPVLANNTVPYSATVAVAADMVATTTVPSGVVAGAPVTVSGLCTNAGPSAAVAPACALSGVPVGAIQTCTLDPVGVIPDPLPVGAAIRCTSTFNAPASGPVSVTTTAGTTTLDPAPGNNAMTRSFTVAPQADMAATGNTLPTTVSAGQAVSGTITCTNNGPSAADAATCTIPGLPVGATVSCTPTSPTASPLASGASITCNVSYVAPASGTVNATVTAGSTTADSVPGNNAAPYVAAVTAQADLVATVSGLPSNPLAGSIVTATVICTNNGPSPANDPRCSVTALPLGAVVTCLPSPLPNPLAVGDSIACSVTLTVPATKEVVLTATSTSTTEDPVPANNLAQQHSQVTPLADMQATTTIPSVVVAGSPVLVTGRCVNAGPSPAVLPGCALSNLPPGTTQTCALDPSGAIADPLPSGAAIICKATFLAPADGVVSVTTTANAATADPDLANNIQTRPVSVSPLADMQAVTTVPATANAGQSVTVSGTCSNNGPSEASAATCALSGLPLGAVQSCLPSPVPALLPVGATITCTATVVVPATGSLSVTTTAGTATPDALPLNDVDTKSMRVTVQADMAATGNTLPTAVSAGQTVSGSITCTNNGLSAADAASCTMPGLPAGATVSCTPTSPTASPLASGASINCNVSYVAPASGTVNATVTAGSTTADTVPTNNTTPYVATVIGSADMQVTVTGVTPAPLAGSAVTGTVICVNAGPSPAINPSCAVTGLPPGATVVCNPNSVINPLPIGGTIICQLSFTAPATGGVTVVGMASSTTPDPLPANNVAQQSAGSIPLADMQAVTTIPASIAAGLPLTVSGTCTNLGPSPATAVTCALSGLPPGATQTCSLNQAPSSLAVGASVMCSSSFVAPSNGVLTINTTASSTTADPIFANNVDSRSASVQLPTSPVAVNDSASTSVNTPVIVAVSVISNDTGSGIRLNDVFGVGGSHCPSPMPAAVAVQATSGLKAGALCTVRGAPGVTCTVPTAHGSVTLCQDGTYTYTPATGYTGIDGFRYEIIDGSGQRASANVDVTISGQPDVITSVTLSPVGPLPGTAVTATVSYGNIGLVSALNVSVTLQMPPGLVGVVASNGGIYDVTTGLVSWPPITTLPPNVVVAGSYTVSLMMPTTTLTVVSGATVPGGEISVANNSTQATLAAAVPVPGLSGSMLLLLGLFLLLLAARSDWRTHR